MFVFYDLETTGTSPVFDQPIQFAAILTDDDFNQIERVDIRCRLSPHILPAPWAMAVTGVTPEQLLDPNLPSWFDFSHQISALIKRWAPATWTGYNTIAFDEEFLRQSFYQNLHPNIYQTQFNHNDRLDLMKVIYAIWDRAPGTLEWPLDDNGRVSFKLDRLAPANGFTAHNAHDALGDAHAPLKERGSGCARTISVVVKAGSETFLERLDAFKQQWKALATQLPLSLVLRTKTTNWHWFFGKKRRVRHQLWPHRVSSCIT